MKTKKSKAGAEFTEASRSDSGAAFIPDPYEPRSDAAARSSVDLAETLAEDYVASATTGEEQGEEMRDDLDIEEVGGPFVETSGAEEFAGTVDEMNPEDAAREPFPTANARRD